MNDFLIGLSTTFVIVVFLEIFRNVDKKLISALTLAVIPFIYIGFSWSDIRSLVLSILGVIVFLTLAYLGYMRNYILIVFGLVLHGVWDVLFPHMSEKAPEGYDVFCITIDLLLALYFYFRLKDQEKPGKF